MNTEDIKIEIKHLSMAYGSYVVMRDINARVKRGSVFVIMGESGSGKSTLLRTMIGLQPPAQGDILYDGQSFWGLDEEARRVSGAQVRCALPKRRALELHDLGENVELPLAQYTDWPQADRQEVVRLKLALAASDQPCLSASEPNQ